MKIIPDDLVVVPREPTELANQIARDIFADGSELWRLGGQVQRIQFMGGDYPDNEIALGGFCEDALAASIARSLRKAAPLQRGRVTTLTTAMEEAIASIESAMHQGAMQILQEALSDDKDFYKSHPSAPPAGNGVAVGALGWKLATRVVQSDLYTQLDPEERGECDALIRANPYAQPSQEAPAVAPQRGGQDEHKPITAAGMIGLACVVCGADWPCAAIVQQPVMEPEILKLPDSFHARMDEWWAQRIEHLERELQPKPDLVEALRKIHEFKPTPHNGRKRDFINWQYAFHHVQNIAEKAIEGAEPKRQPWPNHNWCVGCTPEDCPGCGREPHERRKALTATPPDTQWRDIESAPRDVNLLLYAPPENLYLEPEGMSGEFRVAPTRNWTWASHWMPLPLPPTETASSGEKP